MLSEKARSQQQALWELVETEVAYIRTLKVIQDVRNSSKLLFSFDDTFFFFSYSILVQHTVMDKRCFTSLLVKLLTNL